MKFIAFLFIISGGVGETNQYVHCSKCESVTRVRNFQEIYHAWMDNLLRKPRQSSFKFQGWKIIESVCGLSHNHVMCSCALSIYNNLVSSLDIFVIIIIS